MKILKFKKQIGISLVEIMVAMVISIFLLGGVIQVYIGNKTSYRFADASARIQENARFALDTMSSDLRMAGFWGCAQFLTTGNEHLVNNLNYPPADVALYDFINNDAISAIENVGLNGSDSLTVLGSKAGQNIVLSDMVTTQANVIVSSDANIDANDIAIISNCEGADIFQVSSIAAVGAGQIGLSHVAGLANTQNLRPPQTPCVPIANGQCLSQQYGTSAALSILQTITYSIQAGASGEPALWRSVYGVDDELIEGIEQMQILFGIDQTGDGQPNQYVTGNNVAGSRAIATVRIFLVARSDVDGITDTAQTYNLNGVATVAPDNRLRQVFSITVTLRNRAS